MISGKMKYNNYDFIYEVLPTSNSKGRMELEGNSLGGGVCWLESGSW